MNLKIFSDGGSRNNPGKAACAFVVFKNGKLIYKQSKYLGIKTNNEAEYLGLKRALSWTESFLKSQKDISSIEIFMDSELVVKQLNGVYKIKSEKLSAIHDQIKGIIQKLNSNLIIKHVKREENIIADKLVNETLDENK
jgi:ribonuclease HI